MSDRPDTKTTTTTTTTATTTTTDRRNDAGEFARQAEADSTGVVGEFIDFLRHNKKWWLLPIIIALAVVGVFVLLASSAAAPFIYTLF